MSLTTSRESPPSTKKLSFTPIPSIPNNSSHISTTFLSHLRPLSPSASALHPFLFFFPSLPHPFLYPLLQPPRRHHHLRLLSRPPHYPLHRLHTLPSPYRQPLLLRSCPPLRHLSFAPLLP